MPRHSETDSDAVLRGTFVYVGDVHGTRLDHLERAVAALGVVPDGLLCTMDVDQVLAIRDLDEVLRRYRADGKRVHIVAGNHEAALIFGVGIDSSTYRKGRQETNIEQLAEDINLAAFTRYRTLLESALAVVGGVRLQLGGNGDWSTLLIHGALQGKEEKYLHEFPMDIQTHVRTRGDLWLRLETRDHLLANFRCMTERDVRVMIRGHDHYSAMRSLGPDGTLVSHQLITHRVPLASSADYATEKTRQGDGADSTLGVDQARLSRSLEQGEPYWHELDPSRRYVVNFGPYYEGCFGLVRTATATALPAVAFFKTETSYYTAEDRQMELKPYTRLQQARSGKRFYDLFPRR